MSARTDTHDMGFIVQPALQRDWELFGRQASLDSLLQAATSLATRYDDRVQAIRSWDRFSNAHHNITSMDDDFLVIIDSLCSEYYAIHLSNKAWADHYQISIFFSTLETTLKIPDFCPLHARMPRPFSAHISEKSVCQGNQMLTRLTMQ
jgi:hypothetical protein